MSKESRHQIRQQMRQQRRYYPLVQQRLAANDACRQLLRDLNFIRSHHIAIYWPQQGELDPRPIAEHAWRAGKKVYLPVLAPLRLNQLTFARFTPSTAMTRNRFNILEPHQRVQRLPACQMDIIICPLVAFNTQGHRLGMGGGFYDRTLINLTNRKCIGLAYSWQCHNGFSSENWDVPMSSVITEKKVWHFKHVTAAEKTSTD